MATADDDVVVGDPAASAVVDLTENIMDNGDDTNHEKSKDKTSKPQPIHVYNPRKPKWWNRLGNNGRDATKSQKRAIRKVLDGTATSDITSSADPPGETATGLRLPPVPYGAKLEWDDVFPGSLDEDRDIWLELGFGRGENLQALLESKLAGEEAVTTTMQANDNNNARPKQFYLVGAEVSGVGTGCLCKRIEQQQQRNDDTGYILYNPEMDPFANQLGGNSQHEGKRTDSNTGNSNARCNQEGGAGRNTSPAAKAGSYVDRLRIHAGDGYKLLPKLPDDSLMAILVTFPDPFPKDTDVNYRLIQQQTLIECHRILRKQPSRNSKTNDVTNSNRTTKGGGRLFLATDHDGYHEWCHRSMREVNCNPGRKHEDGSLSSAPILFQPVEPCPNRMEWLPAISRYEQKGWDEGRSTKLSCWIAIEQ